MRKLGKNAGFTLLELLIVVVILGVLAGLSIPVYTSSVERSRRQEAISVLSSVKDSAARYWGLGSTYAGMTYANMDFNPNAAAANGQTVHYTYGAPGTTTSNAFTAVATRTATDGGSTTDQVTINQAGTIS